MGTIVMPGEALFAPIYLPASGIAPSWSGKSVYELSQQDLEEVNSFCLDDAWEMGYEDSMDGRAERENPFHRAFLNATYCNALSTGVISRGFLLTSNERCWKYQ